MISWLANLRSSFCQRKCCHPGSRNFILSSPSTKLVISDGKWGFCLRSDHTNNPDIKARSNRKKNKFKTNHLPWKYPKYIKIPNASQRWIHVGPIFQQLPPSRRWGPCSPRGSLQQRERPGSSMECFPCNLGNHGFASFKVLPKNLRECIAICSWELMNFMVNDELSH